MLDLKGPLDVMNAADAALKKQAAEIAALLSQGTEEATQQALALQETLEKLQSDYDAKKAMYDGLVQANKPSDVAKLFVSTSTTSPDGEKPKGVMRLSEFNALSPKERLAFVNNDGIVED